MPDWDNTFNELVFPEEIWKAEEDYLRIRTSAIWMEFRAALWVN
jgi:hypothetical protein